MDDPEQKPRHRGQQHLAENESKLSQTSEARTSFSIFSCLNLYPKKMIAF